MVKAVIFDMDGVIINSEPLHYEVDKRILSEIGYPVEDRYLDQFVGYTNRAMWNIIKDDLNLKVPLTELINRQISLKIKLLNERPYRSIEGIPELMKQIKGNHIKLGLASSSPVEFIKGVLNKLSLSDMIDKWESGERVERSKPAPDIFLHVARLLESKPDECLVIEDSSSGVTAARTAGMKCIGFKNPHSGNQDLSGADLIVERITDIKEGDFLC
jgi:HAD superfamily hydrolase (TIGR01509 family)